MADKKDKRNSPGTFAQLYDVQEEMSRRSTKPMGRPPKKVQRKPTTVYLTQAESRNLSRLQLLIGDHVTINRSEIVGIAIDALVMLMDESGYESLEKAQIRNVDEVHQIVIDFIKS